MDERRFDGKVALVTGGNSGIGLAVARGLVDEGARVVIVGRNAETVARSAADLGAAAHGVVADTSRLADLDRLVAATRAFGGGRLDVVFAKPASALGPLAATTRPWDATFDVNVRASRPRSEGGHADGQGRCDRPQRFRCGEQGKHRQLGLRREQGGGALVRPDDRQ
jgi:NAD(P)-dependent dehydrogenase (short-subunit alcohol dehydrogenase family)